MVHSATVAAGYVISQAPVGDTAVLINTAVDMVVSLGPMPEVTGDLSGDGDVDAEDVTILSDYWLECCDPCNVNCDPVWVSSGAVPGDVDGDCSVNLVDYVTLAGHWLEGSSGMSGLVGWWKFNEGVGLTVGDASIYNNEGSITGASWVVGHEGWGLAFEGADYVTIPAEAFSSIADEITISLWQYGDAAIQPQADYIFQGYNAAGRVLSCHLPWSDARIYWDAGNDEAGIFDRVYRTPYRSEEFEGQWNHWAFSKSTHTGYMRMYLNGEEWHSDGPGYDRTMEGITVFKIGAKYDGLGNYDGMIDDFRVYDRELSATEIEAIYNGE